MKYLDDFRDHSLARGLLERVRQLASRRWVVMDVCGGQTHSLLRYGIESELAPHIELIHGPGCPVCVTAEELICFAVKLSLVPQTVVATFGDMIRVPSKHGSLMQARTRGGQVRVVYSPLDAVSIAQQHPDTQVVFFAVGFETTAPATALAILHAEKNDIKNFTVIPAHVRVLPAMRAITEAEGNRVDAFLAAGHVCCITGFREYQTFAEQFRVPVVITGFEPVDLLTGILQSVKLLEKGTPSVVNGYTRSVREAGNDLAMTLIERVYVIGDRPWRGFGVIREGGYFLRDEYEAFDAFKRFEFEDGVERYDVSECRGADVMSGRIKPAECSAFGKGCTPVTPLGAPMVSSEGACAAYYLYQSSSVSDTQATSGVKG